MEHFDNLEGFIWYNGNFLPWKDAKVHILNHGLNYGTSVFEGMKIYNGIIFKLKEHLERFKESARLIGLNINYSVNEMENICKELILKNDRSYGYIRPLAFGGCEEIAIGSNNLSTHICFSCWSKNGNIPNVMKKKHVNMIIGNYRKPNPNSMPIQAKGAGMYASNDIEKRRAKNAGYDDALLLDFEGYIAEATTSNFFMVINGQLHTPIADRFLNGLTRQTVIEIAKENNIIVNERRIDLEELSLAQEAFLTGTTVEILPVSLIGKYKFQSDNITEIISDLYYKKCHMI